MTFLNPLVLFGLAAAALPLLLHLLNLRRLRTVDFSSVRFLKELQKTSLRRVRFRQILLLILRTLLIMALVFTFSRPALRASFAGIAGGGASSTMVIILDDSPSMDVRDERGTAFGRAVQSASRLMDVSQEGDRLYLVPLSELRPASALPGPRSPESARRMMSGLAPTPISVPLESALHRVKPLVAGSADANREIVFVSDGQATQIAPAGAPADTSGNPDPATRLFLCFTPSSRHENTGATGGEILTRLVSLGRPVRIRARLTNSGTAPVSGSVVSLYCDGARLAQVSTDIPPQGVVQPVLTFNAKRRGLLAGRIQLEDDALEADNSWHFVLDVPERIGVLLTGPEPASTRLAAIALTLGGDSLLAGELSAVQTTNEAIASTDISRFDLIVMCGEGGLPAAAVERLTRFINDGGGLILFPGDAPSSGALERSLGLPSAAGPPVAAPAGSFFSFSSVEVAHPLFEGMFEAKGTSGRRQPAVESPQILKAVPLRAGEKGITVIGMTNGNSFLVDYSAGKGRVLLFSVEAGTTWSDFPLKGLFAPLLHRAVAYAGSRPPLPASIMPGDPLRFTLRLRTFTDRDTYTVTRPDGETTKVVPEFQPATGTASFSAGTAPAPGVYRLSLDGRTGAHSRDLAAVAVNLAPGESDLRSAGDDDIERFRQQMGIAPGALHVIAPGSEAEAVRQARYGIELWKECALLAALLALAEMAVARSSTRAAAGGGEEPR